MGLRRHRSASHAALPLAVAAALLLLILTVCNTAAPAQPVDTELRRAGINGAADTINLITPQAVGRQSIEIGQYDGQAHEFLWMVETGYPPGTATTKMEENGGPVAARGEPRLNSFNMEYRFLVRNKASDFALTLSTTDENGNRVEKQAALGQGQGGGTVATVGFNPWSGASQTVYIRNGNREMRKALIPKLEPQLGAFVLPNMLISIIYAPPGERSTASYAETSGAGTVVSWGFTQSSAVGVTEDMDPTREMIKNMSLIAAKVSGYDKVGEAIKTVDEIVGKATATSLTSNSHSEENAKGTSFMMKKQYTTEPGYGDIYVVLRDVLFIYYVIDNKVHLLPAAFNTMEPMTEAELRQNLPAADADRYVALNHHLPDRTPPKNTGSAADRFGGRLSLNLRGNATRYVYLDTDLCKPSVAQTTALSTSDYTISGTSSQSTETTWIKVTGLMAAYKGYSDKMRSVTYSSGTQQSQSSGQEATLNLLAGPDETPFEVDIYYDKIFRSFICARGPALPQGEPAVAGMVAPEEPSGSEDGGAPRPRPGAGAPRGGRAGAGVDVARGGGPGIGAATPVAGEKVRLEIGDRRYRAYTDAAGKFEFPYGTIPHGNGVLVVGGVRTPIQYNGTPIRGLTLKRAGPPVASAEPRGGIAPPAAEPRTGIERRPGTEPRPGGEPQGAAEPRARRGSAPARAGGRGAETRPTASEGDTATAIRGRPAPLSDDPAARLEARLTELEERVRQLEAKAAGSAAAEAGVATTPGGDGADAGADDTRTGGATPAPGTAPGTTRGAEGQTGPFGPDGRLPGRAPGGAQGFVVSPNPALKGRLGRVVVTFPKDAKADARVDVTKPNDGNSIKGGYGNFATEVFPGRYDVVINSTKVPVDVVQGSDTRVKAGVLRLNLGKDTRFDVVDDKGASLTGGYGTKDVGLPAGPAKVKIAEQVETVEIKDGQVTEF